MSKPSKELREKLKKHKPFVERRGDMEIAVFCVLTGNKIKGLVVLEDFQEKQRIGNTLVIRERVAVSQLANYAEITIEMDDGSAHVTSICKSTLPTMTREKLEQIYEADMAQMLLDEEAGRGPVKWELWEGRRPLRVVGMEV